MHPFFSPGAYLDSDDLIILCAAALRSCDPQAQHAPALPYSAALQNIFQGQAGSVGLWSII